MSYTNKGYVNLEYIVNSYINRTGEDDRAYEQLLQMAIDGYNELNLNDSISYLKTAIITVNDQNVAPLPDDFVDYLSIGVEHEGRIVPLVLNRNILLPTVQSCGLWEREENTSTNAEFHDATSGRNSALQPNYTVGGGFGSAYYRIDKAERQIVFLTESWKGFNIVLEYKSSGVTEHTVVPRTSIPALREYIHWQKAHYSKGETEASIYRKEQRFLIERKKLSVMQNAFTKEEYLDTIYSHTHRGIE